MKAVFSIGVVLLLAAAPTPREVRTDHPVIGSWQIQVTETCVETHTYRTDGTTYVTSGEEVSKSSYEISDTPNGSRVYVLVDKIETNNGKPDCMGHKTPVDDLATVYVKFSTTGNGMLVCYDETMKACFSMKRVRDV